MRREQFVMVPVSLLERCRDSHAIHLYVRLRRYANADGRAWPPSDKLRRDLGVSVKGLRRAVTCLERLGVVESQRRHRADGAVLGMEYLVVDFDLKVRSDLKDDFGATLGSESTGRTPSHPYSDLDPVHLDPSTLKAAAAPRARPVEKSDPTDRQLTALAADVLADPAFDESTQLADVFAILKDRCGRMHWHYTDDRLGAAVNRVRAANGEKPWMPLKGQRLR